MESRYALRELEGVIGRDDRTLPDGRRAIFKHTPLHGRLKRDYFERRDLMVVMQSIFTSASAQWANMRLSSDQIYDLIEDKRTAFIGTVFPYVKQDKTEDSEKKTESYDDLFDELDEINGIHGGSGKDGE